jgi:tRNA pseudouridine38-40 synthase
VTGRRARAPADEPRRIIRLLLAYDGTAFRGWARQREPSIRTVEGVLTDVVGDVVGEEIRLSVAGRTDAGVHARGQMASFPTSSVLTAERLRAAVNGRLGPEVVALEVADAPAGFDARFSATAREYRYRIDTSEVPDPFSARFVWHRPGPVAVAPMRDAARALLGEHDFASFCRHPGSDRSTHRRLERLSVRREGHRLELSFRANAFLHQMVRSLVGMLVLVGDGRRDPDDIAAVLEARDRSGTGNLAPPHGLTLERVVYGRRR